MTYTRNCLEDYMPQPAPDTGEWHEVRIYPTSCQLHAKDYHTACAAVTTEVETLRNAVVPKLVAALEAAREMICKQAWSDAVVNKRLAEALILQIDAALAAVGQEE